MRLNPLLQSAGIPAVLADPEISSLSYDSRRAASGSLFFALPGAKTNGAEFAQQAADKGAAAVVAESRIPDCGCPVVEVPDARAAMADIAASFYGHPDRSLKCAAVTGTNGKTTTAFLLDALLAGEHDRMATPSARIVGGRPVDLGTGAFDLWVPAGAASL